MITVAPSTSYEATLEAGITGLVGTLAVGTYDGDTATQALSTANINEIGTSGVYVATRTSPATAGQYVLVWTLDGTLDPDEVSTEDLLVTSNAPVTVGSGNLYVTVSELKATLNIGSTYADDDVEVACAAASRCCDGYKTDRFYPTTETRYYTAHARDTTIEIDSLNTLTSVTIDLNGDGTYETTWAVDTDFILTPANAAANGHPWTQLKILPQSGRIFPRYPKTIKIVGSFGWAETPSNVAQASRILAGRLLKRSRETPYGIVVVAGDAVAAARLGRIDPDVAFLLDNLPGTTPLLAI